MFTVGFFNAAYITVQTRETRIAVAAANVPI
jgi:hypothetical protein